MEVHVFGRAEIEEGILIRCAYAVISIRDPGRPRAKIKKQAGLRDQIFLTFHDAEPTIGFNLPAEIKLITPAQADEICDFVHRHKTTVGAIVVHCEQGMSRSPAVAAAISDALGLDPGRFWQLYTPNQHVYHTVAHAFERDATGRKADNQ